MFNPLIFSHREDLEEMMRRIGVSDDGIEIMSKKGDFYTIRLHKIPLKGAILLKQEALAAGMECALPWCTAALKCDPVDAILMGTSRQFQILARKMRFQPFKGPQIAEEIEEAIENYNRREFSIKARDFTIEIPPVKIMGILNVTPDSFSDGGKFNRVDRAVEHAHRMVKEGADIIDIGGESSRPFSSPVSEEEELRRVIPVLEELSELKVPISIDTYKSKVAEEALKRGVSIVNDIFGLRREGMAEVIADYGAAVVIMHMKGEPKNMQMNPHYEDVIGEIMNFFRERVEFAVRKGIEEDRIILDPGIGFGKRVEDNLTIIKHLDAFRTLGFPLLIGVSRKSYMGKLFNLDVDERLETTIASNVVSVLNGASILRVHDVKENLRAVRMAEAIIGVKP